MFLRLPPEQPSPKEPFAMSHTTLAWAVIALYACVTLALAFRGFFQTQNLRSFTLGSGGDLPGGRGPLPGGTARQRGHLRDQPGPDLRLRIPALLGIGLATSSGVIVGLTVLSPSFRRIGRRRLGPHPPGLARLPATTRDKLRVAMALVSMLLITFVVMIVVGIGYVLEGLVGVPAVTGAGGTIAFVFGYVLLGGANTSSTPTPPRP